MKQRRSKFAVAAVGMLGWALVSASCDAPPTVLMRPPIPTPPERDRLVATAYPSLTELYQGAQGIYRGCGPNGNVCHNARQYPNLNTLGAITQAINQPCNQLQDDPSRMDDWCEREGDIVRMGGMRFRLGYIQRIAEATETQGSRWAVAVQGTAPMLMENRDLAIIRERPGRDDQWMVGFDSRQLSRDATRPNVIFVQLDMDDEYIERILNKAGIPAERDAIQFGDPNRNGVYGFGMNMGLLVPGHPERSYLLRRLIDPTAGPLMPLANCCSWSKESLRALWCWVANLRPDGSNAMDPIDYSVCPDGPMENVAYPTPGPMCENAGLCPVHVRTPIEDAPTWSNIYNNVIVSRCGGNGCHRGGETAGSLDLGTSEVAYEQLLRGMAPRVIPGNPMGSLFLQRMVQACPPGSSCRRMPLGQAPLPQHELGVINRWIERGAPYDGMMPFDAGPPVDVVADRVAIEATPGDVVVQDRVTMPEPGPEAGPPDVIMMPDVVDVQVPPDVVDVQPGPDTVDVVTDTGASMDAAADTTEMDAAAE